MSPWTLVRRGLRFHWRTHLGVAGGAAVGTAVLVGALAVGDSVRHSLAALALERLGAVRFALEAPDRTFRDALADDLAAGLPAGSSVAPVLLLPGLVAREDGGSRVLNVRVHGVDARFGRLAGERAVPPAGAGDAVVLGEAIAARLGVRAGDTVLVRVGRPGLLPRDAPLSGEEDVTAAARFTVAAVAPDGGGGRFSLRADQAAPHNAFLPLARLQALAGQAGRANVLLAGTAGDAAPDLAAALRAAWRPDDAGLLLREWPGQGLLEVRTPRVFLEPPVVRFLGGLPGAQGVLTYFVNELKAGDRAAPYSMVSATGALSGPPAGPGRDLRDDEILLNAWLADDLHAGPGDSLEMAYFVPGPGRALEERRARFRVKGVLPMRELAGGGSLMPDYPGLSDVDNCRDWKPGIPIHVDRIRKQDEAYWKEHRGTPKAFVSLAAATAMWANRFGALTAVRFADRPGLREEIGAAFRQRLDPASLGLVFQPVREQALAAAALGQDFGGLFLGFSFFLILASLMLVGLLFTLGVEQRAGEAGTLLATGFTPARVRGLFLMEGGVLALAGGLAGAAGGLAYAKGVLLGLSTVWKPAVTDASGLRFHVEPATLATGALAGFVLALASIAWALRGLARRPVRELLLGAVEAAGPPRPVTWALRLRTAVPGFILAAAAMLWPVLSGGTPSSFFLSGALLLAAFLVLFRGGLLLVRDAPAANRRRMGWAVLALSNAVRRAGRTTSIVALVASGVFIVNAVFSNWKDPGAGAGARSSGTGGFTLWATSSVPIYHDLNTAGGREALGIEAGVLEGATVVPLRVRDGDDASCLNLNRAQRPRVLGVRPGALSGRFTFVDRAGGTGDAWALLDGAAPGPDVPAVADQATATWALGRKGVGDAIPHADEQGRPLDLRLVGTLDDSLLQGSLVVSEAEFLRRFPSASGYGAFLIEVPGDRVIAVARELSRALQDYGFEIMPAARRLAQFNAVANTYLSVFLALGGLGLLLGSLGLGVVVARNVLERRGELALMRAVGFETRALRWLVFCEHGGILLCGMAGGAGAAALALVPHWGAGGSGFPGPGIAAWSAAVLASGLLWTWLAAAWALRGPLLAALRSE